MSKLQRWRAPTYVLPLPIEEGLDKEDPDVISDHLLTLRGLSLNDITLLLSEHQTELAALFSLFFSDGKVVNNISLDDTKAIGTALLQASPAVAGAIIALAAGEPESQKSAVDLPFPVQMEALENIGRLTFDAQGGPKKVLEIVTRVLNGMTSILGSAGNAKLKSF